MTGYINRSIAGATVLATLLCAQVATSGDSPAVFNGKPDLLKKSDQFTMPTVFSGTPMKGADAGKVDCMIEPFSMVEVASSESGIVEEVLVERGSIVKKDEVLAVLESGVQKANAQHASVKLDYLTQKHKRLNLLYEQNVIAYNELEEVKAELELAMHESQRAQEMLRLRTIRSPFSGVVVDKYISPGELTEQQKVLKVAQLNPLKVEIIAPLGIYGSVRQGVAADVWPEGPVSGPFAAEVNIVDKVIDAASGTFGISLLMANADYKIPAGVKCMAKILPKSKRKAVIRKRLAANKSGKRKSKKSTSRAIARVQGTKLASNGRLLASAMTTSKTMIASVNGNVVPGISGSEGPTAAELQDIIVRFVSAYEGGEVEQFESIFIESAKSNERTSLEGIKKDYEVLFENSSDRQLFISSLEWVHEENIAKGIGTLSAMVQSAEEGLVNINGKIQFVAEKSENKVRITHMYHYDLKVKKQNL